MTAIRVSASPADANQFEMRKHFPIIGVMLGIGVLLIATMQAAELATVPLKVRRINALALRRPGVFGAVRTNCLTR